MLSQLSIYSNTQNDPIPDWGTAFEKRNPALSYHASTWIHHNLPAGEKYDLTSLRKSNVRINDQIMPDMNHYNVGLKQINKEFPSEHPYASHICRLDVFPSFKQPKTSSQFDSTASGGPYNVIVNEKIKGNFAHHETLYKSSDAQRKSANWSGEYGFPQKTKLFGGNTTKFYPFPKKLVCPNPQVERPITMQMSNMAENTLCNLSRFLNTTTYNTQYSGYGPKNPLDMDTPSDMPLRQIFANEETLPIPLNGRIARKNNPKLSTPHAQVSQNRKIKQSKSELEERQLLYGKEYVNLPDSSPEPLMLENNDEEKDEEQEKLSCRTNNFNELKTSEMYGNSTYQCRNGDEPETSFPSRISQGMSYNGLIRQPILEREATFGGLKSVNNITLPEPINRPATASGIWGSGTGEQRYIYGGKFDGIPGGKGYHEKMYESKSGGNCGRNTSIDMYGPKYAKRFEYRNAPTYFVEGTPLSQTVLRGVQDSWSRTNALKEFHTQFPETCPKLTGNTMLGRRHTFYGRNSQEIHG